MFDLFKAIGLGLAVLLPLANPLTTVALFLGLAGNMNNAERNKQALMASVYVFAILMVSWYAGQVVMNTFGISIPGLRIAGGLIVAFIGFRMLFPQQKAHDSMEAKIKSEELQDEPTANIAFVPLAMPSTAGPGTIAMIISSASTVKHGVDFPEWVVLAAPPPLPTRRIIAPELRRQAHRITPNSKKMIGGAADHLFAVRGDSVGLSA
ncbi:multiple antibiotic resistance protein MarC [Klebsiella pneumoniae]|nr:multiple antibiotic resistance protein MarC [Klebsiella pneumoniae]